MTSSKKKKEQSKRVPKENRDRERDKRGWGGGQKTEREGYAGSEPGLSYPSRTPMSREKRL